jgi:integrase/recombinase XerC
VAKKKFRHLYRPKGQEVWRYKRRVPKRVAHLFPAGLQVIDNTTGTRDPDLATAVRDMMDRDIEEKLALAALNRPTDHSEALRQAGLREKSEGISPVLDEIAEEIDGLAARHVDSFKRQGSEADAFDAARDWVMENTERGRTLKARLDAYHGRESYSKAGERFLPSTTLKKHTQTEYKRAYKLADAMLPPMDRVTKADVKGFVIKLAAEKSAPTVKKYLGALGRLFEFLDLEPDPFRGHKVDSKVSESHRDVWTEREIKLLLDAAVQPWVKDAIAIAIHTGARAGAIAGMTYDVDTDTIIFPKAKREKRDRPLPCPEAIRENVKRWVADRKTQSTIGNTFTKTRDAAGLTPKAGSGTLKDFHSFRHTFLSRCSDIGMPEQIAQRIVGHKSASITFGVYGNKGEAEALREWVNKVKWRL